MELELQLLHVAPTRALHVSPAQTHSPLPDPPGCSPPETPRLARRELLAGLCLAAAMACSRPAAAAGEAAAAAAAPSEAVAVAEAAAAAPAAAGSAGEVVPIYFGNGCFWGRQFEFVNAEAALGRDAADISAVVGYAGGRQQGPDGKVRSGPVLRGSAIPGAAAPRVPACCLRPSPPPPPAPPCPQRAHPLASVIFRRFPLQVCYYYSDELSVYEPLGHAEVVQVRCLAFEVCTLL